MTFACRSAFVLLLAQTLPSCGNDAAPSADSEIDAAADSSGATADAFEPPPVDAAPDAADSQDTLNDGHRTPGPDASGDVAEDGQVDTTTEGPWQPGQDLGFLPLAQPSDALFRWDDVMEVEVTIHPDDWDALRSQTRTLLDIVAGEDCLAHPPESIFDTFEADVVIDGVPLNGVGIRKKGFLGSLDDERPSLKIRFDEFVDGQTLLGLDRVTLNNNRQDPSRLNTCLAYRVFAAAGYPAPRCGFAHVRVNGKSLGVYSHVDSVKKPYLRRFFDDDDGNLYEGTLSDFRPAFRGTFQKKTNEKADDWSDIDAIVELFAESDGAWQDRLSEHINMPRFLRFWAVESLIHHWDGYAGNINNFYIYRDPDDGRFAFLPWGADSCFFDPKWAASDEFVPSGVMTGGILAHALYADPYWRQAFAAELAWLLQEIWDEDEVVAWVDQGAATVAAASMGDQIEAAQQDTERIYAFVVGRESALLPELGPEVLEWNEPLPEPFCWVEAGGIDVSFSTSWGTAGDRNLFETGSGEVHAYESDDVTPTAWSHVGASAGLSAQPSYPGESTILLAGLLPGGGAELINVLTWSGFLTPATSIPLDWINAQAYRFRVYPPFDTEPDFRGFVANGVLELDEFAATPGAPVTGRLDALFYSPTE